MAIRSFILIGLIVSASDTGAGAQFTPGHIFVSDFASKHCAGQGYPGDRIWEIDPETGEVSLFVELQDEWCGGIEALVFTPDGTRLRAAQYLQSRIIELDADANPTVLYTSSDGIIVQGNRI
jgi:DNA-binding beta-propeller fold protein YncE